jgi:hypothetical protein
MLYWLFSEKIEKKMAVSSQISSILSLRFNPNCTTSLIIGLPMRISGASERGYLEAFLQLFKDRMNEKCHFSIRSHNLINKY